MANTIKYESNIAALDEFKENRPCYNDNGILWTTNCDVHCLYAGKERDYNNCRVWIRSSAGQYHQVELRGLNMEDDVTNTIFSVKQATISYEDDKLIIEGRRKKAYYKISIGEYVPQSDD